MFKKWILTLAFIFAITTLVSGCAFKLKKPNGEEATGTKPVQKAELVTPQTAAEKLAAQSQLKKFNSLDELSDWLENSVVSPQYDSLWGGVESVRSGFSEKSAALTDAVGTAGNEGSSDYSKTNVQVEGVDEADIIKTDGQYIYAVTQKDLFIIEAYPATDARILSKIEFKSRPENIYISGNYLAIYGRNNEIYREEVYKSFRRRNDFTFLKIFDITDKKNPRQTRSLDFEGGLLDSRLIGDYVYLITANYNYYYMNEEPVLPRVLENGITVGCAAGAEKCVMPDVYYFDTSYDSHNFTTVTAINIKDSNEAIESDIYLLSGGQNVYASQNNIYITYTKYISEYDLESEVLKDLVLPRLSEKDRDKIEKIGQAESFVLSDQEKTQKIRQIMERYTASLEEEEQEKLAAELKDKMKQKYQDLSKELEKTVIHKIGVSGKNMEYKASGEVTGQVLNQFSMDENNTYFRIATTKNRTWSGYENEEVKSYNNLYVLDENLKITGAVENLAEDERIYSVRFMQNRAYMVTFRQMDPLFVIDLSDPRAPKVLGKLKIPGFSNYLHPYDDNTLIGIGRDAHENESGGINTGGIKLSLFDVTDVANPVEKDSYVIGESGSDSIALYDHKAFLFNRDKELLVIPASIREPSKDFSGGALSFSGALVFRLDRNGFELKGKIDHSDGGQGSDRDFWKGYNYYDNTVKRGLYISDVLYTFSNNYLKMNNIGDLKLVNSLKLNDSSQDDFKIIN